jgi:hypothetical protein
MPQYPEDGSEADKRTWRDRMDIYKVQAGKWDKQVFGLDAVNEWILDNLDPTYHTRLLNYETLYQRLVYLEKRFARAAATEEAIRV